MLKRNKKLQWNDWKAHNFSRVYPLDSPKIENAPENGDMVGNAVLGEKTFLDMDRVWGMNLNMLVYGTPGTGKTRSFIKPNLLQFNSSYVVTDPNGELLESTGAAFIRHGYRVKVLNMTDTAHSDRYNPFRYVKDVSDLDLIAECLMANTDASGTPEDDDFFRKAEWFLLLAVMNYIWYELPTDDQNMGRILDILREAENEADTAGKTELDLRFEQLEAQHHDDNKAVSLYNDFRQAEEGTRRDIAASCLIRLKPFEAPGFRELTSEDTLHLEELGDRKQILYVISPIENARYGFLGAMAYSQLFQALYDRSEANRHCWMLKKGPNATLRSPVWHTEDDKGRCMQKLKDEREMFLNAELDGLMLLEPKSHMPLKRFQSQEEYNLFMDCVRNGEIVCSDDMRLPCNVRCIMDEFANTFVIPKMDIILNTCRKYDISCDLIIMSLGQLKRMYMDDYSAIVDGCSTQMYLSVSSIADSDRVSSLLGGAEYVHDMTRSMDRNDCMIFMSGEAPFYDKKYLLELHRNYYEIDSSRPENHFDYRKFF